MTKPGNPLPLALARQIDAVCDQFEADWKAGRKPRIEDYLARNRETHRGELLRALLRLELDLLGGTNPGELAAGYFERFPDQKDVVDDVVRSALDRTAAYHPQASVETSVSRSSVRQPAAPPGVPAPSPMPKCIGRFEVIERIGHGAFGQVFRARDPHLDREVAIKVPLKGALQSDEETERFLREAKTAATLHHPNICPVYEVGQMGKVAYIVMGLVRGQSLSEHLKSRKDPVPAKQAALVVRKLALALQAAHDRGIVHRDLKPANVMFDRDRKDVVIMDFGLARRERPGDIRTTREGTVMGSPAYMPPEQARGDVQAIGPHSDVYSLGVMLYEMLAGRLPFTGSVNEVIGKVLHVPPDPPSAHRRGVDPALEAICLKSMAKSPADRHASMRELAEALSRYLQEPADGDAAPAVPSPAGPEPATASVGVLAALSAEHRAETEAVVEAALERSAKGIRRTALLIGVPALVMVGVLTLAVFLLLQKPSGTNQTTIDNSVTQNSVLVSLQNIPHLHETWAVFVLDGEPVPADKLRDPLRLEIGRHELVIKKGERTLEVRQFQVGSPEALAGVAGAAGQARAPQRVIVPVPEPEGKVGELTRFTLPQPASGVAVSPDGRWLLAAGYHHHPTGHPDAGIVHCWDLTAFKDPPRTFALTPAAKVAFDPRANGQAALGTAALPGSSNQTGIVQFWDTDRWRDLHNVQTAPTYLMDYLQYSPDGKYLVAGWSWPGYSPKTVVWEADSGKEVAQFPKHMLCFAADGRHLYEPAGEKGNEVQMIDLATKKVTRTYKGHSSPVHTIACSRDGKYMAAGTTAPTNAVRVWDVDSAKEVQAMIGHSGAISSLDFSPDGRRLLSAGSSDGAVRLWEVATGKLLQTFQHETTVREVRFSPAGRRAVSGSADGTVRLWQLPD